MADPTLTDPRAELAGVKRFDQLIRYLRDRMGWPIDGGDFEEMTFEYTPEELGIDAKNAAKIQEIKRLRPLSPKQPWGIFFVKFEPKKLPVVALRRILSQVALKKRASANSAERAAWAANDLLFISNYGEGDERQISFAHFSKPQDSHDLPTLKVLGWDNLDTALHLDAVAKELTQNLAWPDDDADVEAWRTRWRAAFSLRHREVVNTSRDLSIRLADLARAIRDRIKAALAIETVQGPLTKLMNAFRTVLVHDLDVAGFSDMYAQTIAYGLLSARITDPEKKTADDFASHMRTNPFLRELMETFLKVGGRRGKAGGPGIDFDELGVSEVIDLLDDANMEAVVQDFGDRNPEEDPVIHFYELFLKEYDAKERMQRGVFYTPRPVVSYIVRSMDELLRKEFGLTDGLADTTTWGELAERHKDLKLPPGVSASHAFIQILDPATGTGTFLVEVIDVIHKTLVSRWNSQDCSPKEIEALWNEYVPHHLLPRLHGFELLMAPYAIAHLKVGLKLYETGYRFGSNERARVYLTNALEPAADKQLTLDFLPALAHEARAVSEIKKNQRFTVVIGNPPYSGHSANASKTPSGGFTFIGSLIQDYFFVDGRPLGEKNPKWLQDDYVKFLRFGQYQLQQTGVGALGFITNHGYLDNPTFRGMRQNLMQCYNWLHFYDLHGNIKKREASPDGLRDENVFDIQQGVAICVMVRSFGMSTPTRVTHADLFGPRSKKYAVLLAGPTQAETPGQLSPNSPYYLFVSQAQVGRSFYDRGWKVTEIFPLHSLGVVTARDHVCIRWTAEDMWATVRDFASLPAEKARSKYQLGKDARDWKVTLAQQDLQKNGGPDRDYIVPILYRPFDTRFTYFTGNSRGFLCMPRAEVMQQMLAGNNVGLHVVRQSSTSAWQHALATNRVTDTDYVSNLTSERGYLLPLFRFPNETQRAMGIRREPNINQRFVELLSAAVGTGTSPEDIFNYVYAILYSPAYRNQYAEFLKIDFPRIPLPNSHGAFQRLARIGSQLVALHLFQSPKLSQELTSYRGPKNPEVKRVGWSDDTVWIDATATKKGHDAHPGTIGFGGVAEKVWAFQVGSYQVCEKWLKDRKGRTLSESDIAHYEKIVVAVRETIKLTKEIDEIIAAHGGWPAAFSASGDENAHQ